MLIDFFSLSFSFSTKPLVIGGKAMEYYGLRAAGADTDLVVIKEDFIHLAEKYPSHLKDLWGDLGVAVAGFEIWKTVNYFDYHFLAEGAVEEDRYVVISLEKLLLQKALTMSIPKYHQDLELVSQKIIENQLHHSQSIKKENDQILAQIS